MGALQNVEKKPYIGTLVGVFTGKFPESYQEAFAMDMVEAVISIIPVAGDIVTGVGRSVRYITNPDIPPHIKAEIEAMSIPDMLLGFIPGIGDGVDFALMTNTYAFGLMDLHKRAERKKYEAKVYVKEKTKAAVRRVKPINLGLSNVGA